MTEKLYHNEWEAFFDLHAEHYLENEFTQHTVAEVDFIIANLPLPQNGRILDVGCGPGRHAIELARRGYEVTAIDFSEKMIELGTKLAQEAGVEVKFECVDATTYVAKKVQDAAICVCEGAFNLIGMNEDPLTHDLSILKNVHSSLRTSGAFLLTALNGYRMIRNLTDEMLENQSFDPLTMVSQGVDVWQLPEGATEIKLKERLYIPPEITAMLYHAGFQVMGLYGGTAGQWKKDRLKLEDIEAMFICRKRA